MTTAGTAERAGRRTRLTGVDAARGLALAGMAAVHVMPDRDSDGSVSLAFLVASGRSSALFAVLAGVGLALAAGGPHPRSGPALRAARLAVAGRAGVVAAIGLTLGSLGATVAVILAYYGALFLVALPVLGWTARRLAVIAAVSALVTPVVSVVLRSRPPFTQGPGDNVAWDDLARPGELVTSLLLTGYYPVLTWTAYLFAGMAVGRCALGRPAVAARVAVSGGLLAAAGLGVQQLAVRAAGGWPGLGERLGVPPDVAQQAMATTMYGTTPADSWWWLLLAGRHSGSGPDLLHTGGAALLVLGCCLLVVPRLGRYVVVSVPVVAVGAMTLTLYTLHVLALESFGDGASPGGPSPGAVLLLHLAAALAIAGVVGAPAQRGPLEALAAAVAGVAARPAGGASGQVRRSAPTPPAADDDGPPSAGTPPA